MRGAWLTLVVTTLQLTTTDASANTVSPGTQAKNLLRVVTHDRNFGKRFGDEIVIAVLYLAKDSGSEAAANEMKSAIAALGESAIKGRKVNVITLAYQSEDELAGAIRGSRVNILYVCSALQEALVAISDVARKRDVITVGANRELVAGGLSFGIVAVDGKTKILVNVSASRKEGTKFSAQLLKVAMTVD